MTTEVEQVGARVERTGPWLKWAWRHFSLYVDTYPTLRDAVEEGEWAADAGTEALSHYEGPDGLVSDQDVELVRCQIEEDRLERQRSADVPRVTHTICLTPCAGAPTTESAHMRSVSADEDADAVITEWRAAHGDRITVREWA